MRALGGPPSCGTTRGRRSSPAGVPARAARPRRSASWWLVTDAGAVARPPTPWSGVERFAVWRLVWWWRMVGGGRPTAVDERGTGGGTGGSFRNRTVIPGVETFGAFDT
jgi:hypothetical protein